MEEIVYKEEEWGEGTDKVCPACGAMLRWGSFHVRMGSQDVWFSTTATIAPDVVSIGETKVILP